MFGVMFRPRKTKCQFCNRDVTSYLARDAWGGKGRIVMAHGSLGINRCQTVQVVPFVNGDR